MTRSHLTRCIAVPLLVGALGCASVEVTPLDNQVPQREEVRDRNYTLGEPMEAVVGQPIISVKTYQVSRRSAARVRASSDFVIKGGEFRIAGREGEEFEVTGTAQIDGRLHHAVPLLGYEFFVSEDGEVHPDVKTARYRWNISSKARVEPVEARLMPQSSEDVTAEGVYANYELIFGGSAGGAIQVTYREFAPDDPSRPSFFQSLSYEADSETLRYKDLVVKVLGVTNQTLSYVVVSDGS